MVDELLGLAFGDGAVLKIAVDVDIKEGGDSTNAHRGAVLRLDGREIAKVEPLHRFSGIIGWLRDVVAIAIRHDLHRFQGTDLL